MFDINNTDRITKQPYMLTTPFLLDRVQFRSSGSNLELVQFYSSYWKITSVQFQFQSRSKNFSKNSFIIPTKLNKFTFFKQDVSHLKPYIKIWMKFKWFGTKARKIAFLKVNMQGLMDQFWFIVVRISFISQKRNWTDLSPEWTNPFQFRSIFLEMDCDPLQIRKMWSAFRNMSGTVAFSSLTYMSRNLIK